VLQDDADVGAGGDAADGDRGGVDVKLDGCVANLGRGVWVREVGVKGRRGRCVPS